MIRKAKKTDARAIAPLLYNALHEIAEKLTGAKEKTEVLKGLENWFSKTGNRLSYENCFVEELDGKVVGIIVAYHGSHAKAARCSNCKTPAKATPRFNHYVRKRSRIR